MFITKGNTHLTLCVSDVKALQEVDLILHRARVLYFCCLRDKIAPKYLSLLMYL
jgi:hypothetical protein